VPYLLLARQAIVSMKLTRAVKLLRAARRCWNQRRLRCGFTRAQYLSVEGVLYLEYGRVSLAIRALRQAVKGQPQHLLSWFYLGQALFRKGHDVEAIHALQRARSVGKKLPDYYVLLARAQQRAKQFVPARATLTDGLARFPHKAELWRETTLLFARLGFFHAAVHSGRSYLTLSPKKDPLAYTLVAGTLGQAGHHRQALAVLEEARLFHPTNPLLLRRLAFAYVRANMPYTAASLFARLAKNDPAMAYAAAEQYRVAACFQLALRYNTLVRPQTRRTLQQANIRLGEEDYDRALFLLRPLWKKGVLDPPSRYRMAYAALKTGHLLLTRQLLDSLYKTALRRSALRLSALLQRCQKEPSFCL